jgi:hypothetical protein
VTTNDDDDKEEKYQYGGLPNRCFSQCNARALLLSNLYLIIKELRFLPKFSSNFYLDRFTLPPNRILLCNAIVHVRSLV